MQKKNIIITVVVALVVGGAGFFGGTVYEKSSLNTQGLLRSAARGQDQGGAQGQNRPGGMGFNRGANGGGGFATGQIIAKDDPAKPDGNGAGKSITIKANDGSSKIVFFSDSTTVGKTVPGSAADLNNGEQVMVNGKSNPDGTLTAQNIQIRPDQPQQP